MARGSSRLGGRCACPPTRRGRCSTRHTGGGGRGLRGPRADPRAHLLIRPYLRKAVYVEVADADAPVPYWLLFTRRPAELAAAIERSRPGTRAGTPVG